MATGIHTNFELDRASSERLSPGYGAPTRLLSLHFRYGATNFLAPRRPVGQLRGSGASRAADFGWRRPTEGPRPEFAIRLHASLQRGLGGSAWAARPPGGESLSHEAPSSPKLCEILSPYGALLAL